VIEEENLLERAAHLETVLAKAVEPLRSKRARRPGC
jgi:hypothetical protein